MTGMDQTYEKPFAPENCLDGAWNRQDEINSLLWLILSLSDLSL